MADVPMDRPPMATGPRRNVVGWIIGLIILALIAWAIIAAFD